MIDQNTFTETLRAVKEIVRTSAEPMSRDEILSYFKDMELDRQQEELVFEFLSASHEEDESTEEPAEAETEKGTRQTEAMPGTEAEQGIQQAEALETAERKEDVISDSPVFQMYLEELEGIPGYEEEQMTDMYKRLLAGEEGMVHELSRAWLSNVLEIAKKLTLSPDGLEDIVQEGNMALFLRLGELCGSRKTVDVEEELLTAVEEAMKACIREQTGEDEQESAIVGKVALVNEAVKYLKEQEGHEPSLKEISDYVQIPEEELSALLRLIEKAGNKKSNPRGPQNVDMWSMKD